MTDYVTLNHRTGVRTTCLACGRPASLMALWETLDSLLTENPGR
jgi:hypothetical protein